MRIDLTNPNKTSEKLLLFYGGAGLPYAVVLDSYGNIEQRLPDIFTSTTLVKAIYRAGRNDHVHTE